MTGEDVGSQSSEPALILPGEADSSAATVSDQSGKVRRRPARVGGIQIGARTATVAEALGSNAKLASLLEVSTSQPTQWIKGVESPNSQNARTIVDLDHVIARAGLLWERDVISSWLHGRNAFLEGARPIDVIKTQGSSAVVDALDQELAGAYA